MRTPLFFASRFLPFSLTESPYSFPPPALTDQDAPKQGRGHIQVRGQGQKMVNLQMSIDGYDQEMPNFFNIFYYLHSATLTTCKICNISTISEKCRGMDKLINTKSIHVVLWHYLQNMLYFRITMFSLYFCFSQVCTNNLHHVFKKNYVVSRMGKP